MGNRVPELAAFEHLGINGSSGLKRVLVYGLDSNGDAVALSTGSAGGLGTPSTITSGRKAVASAGTAVQLVASSTPCSYVLLTADTGNTDYIVVGGSGIVATEDAIQGTQMFPGNAPVRMDVDDVQKIYVDAINNGDSVCFTYFS